MNIVLFYGSERKQNLWVISKMLEKELIHRGHTVTLLNFRPTYCIGCRQCQEKGECVIKDSFTNFFPSKCDRIIILSPIYFFGYSAKAKSFLDRLMSVNLEGKILTSITLSGSKEDSYACGFDIIKDILNRISLYCGSTYVEPINFVTKDKKLNITNKVEEKVFNFIDDLERG